jgi:hypothetical protein
LLGRELIIKLISRRAYKLGGTRYNARGIDEVNIIILFIGGECGKLCGDWTDHGVHGYHDQLHPDPRKCASLLGTEGIHRYKYITYI